MSLFKNILPHAIFATLSRVTRPAAFITVLLASFLLACPGGAAAKPVKKTAPTNSEAADQPLFLKMEVHMEKGDPCLVLQLIPDEEACRKAYGRDWRQGCRRSLYLAGRPAKGVRLSPPHAGEWRWKDDFTLLFRPSAPWPAGRTYTLELAGLPSVMRVSETRQVLAVPPLEAEAVDYGFKRNPEKLSDMVVSGKLRFNHAVVESDVPSLLSWRLVREGKEIASGPVSEPLFWNASGTEAVFTVPIRNLPDREAGMLVELADGFRPLNGGEPGFGTTASVLVPGLDTAFFIQDVHTETVTNARLAGEQRVYLNFSLAVPQGDLGPRLSARLLPRDRVITRSDQAPYAWQGLAEVTPEILAQSTPLDLEPVDPAARGAIVAYRLKAEPGRAFVLSVRSDLPGPQGLKLSGENTFLVRVPSQTPELKLLQDGAVLALTGEKTLSIYARGLDKVRWKAARVRPEYLNHLITQSYGSFVSPKVHGIGMDQLTSVSEGTLPLVRKDGGSPQFAALDLAPLLTGGEKGLFYLTMSGEAAGRKVCESEPRFVLVTDLGLIHKTAADGTGEVYVASLSRGGPAPEVRIRALGRNGLPVFEGFTDANGRVPLPDLYVLENEKSVVVITAEAGKDLSFLPFWGSELVLKTPALTSEGRSSTFGLNAYLFSERGVYRPGETVRFGALLKKLDWNPEAVEGLPLKAVLQAPGEGKSREMKLRVPPTGLVEGSWTLSENAPTGDYDLLLCLDTPGEEEDSLMVFDSLRVQVQEFQPDSMRLNAVFDPAPANGWLKPDNLIVRTVLHSLHGSPAQDRLLRARLRLSPPRFRFPQYRDWTFFDAAPALNAMRPQRDIKEPLADQRTDQNGEAAYQLDLGAYRKSSFFLEFEVQGFEAAGGRAVTESVKTLVSPLDFVVGVRSDANLAYLRKDGEAKVEFMAVGPDLRPRAAGRLRFETLAKDWVKALVRDNSGAYRYDTQTRERPVSEKTFELPATGLAVPLELSAPGDFALVVRNEHGLQVARVDYSVAGNAAAQFGADRAPALRLRTDKTDYRPGEEMELFLSTPYKGAGLITIERDRIAAAVWFKAEAGDSVQHIRLPEDFEGRGYVNVVFFRALESTDIFTKPLASAVAPFTAGMQARDMDLRLEAPQKIRPGETLTVDVRAAEKGKAVIFAVDEGILQLTRYVTPDPLDAFLSNRALEVRTSQMFDLLMPEYSLLADHLSAFGGGADPDLTGGRLNPFKRRGEPSMVFWSGLVDVGPEASRVAFPIPPWFNGSLRIMAVAASSGRVGAARTDTASQAEVVIMPNFPLVVAPGDEFDGNVTLTNTTAGPLTARLTAETGEGLTLIGNEEATAGPLLLPPGRDITVRLRFKALDMPGNVPVRLAASGEGFRTAERPVSLSVRPATPALTVLRTGWAELKPGSSLSVPLKEEFYSQWFSSSASVSALPLPALYGLSRFVEEYPYGCTEQIVSGAFPSLLFLRHPHLAPAGFDPDKARATVIGALDTLHTRNNIDYDFQAWPSGAPVTEAVQAYVADFLTTVQECGLSVQPGLKNGVLRRLRETASRTPWSLAEGRARAYAAWVLTRNGVVTTNILAGLTQRLDARVPAWRSDVTASLIAGSWKLLRSAQADSLIAGYRPLGRDAWKSGEAFFDPLTERALHLAVLAGQFPDRLAGPEARALVRDIVTMVNEKRYVTVSAALSGRALLAYAGAMPAGLQQLTVSARDKDGNSLGTPDPRPDAPARSLASPHAPGLRYIFTAPETGTDTKAGGFWQVQARGFPRQPPQKAETRGLELIRSYARPDGTPLAERNFSGPTPKGGKSRRVLTGVAPGDEILVTLRARSYGREVRDVVLADLLPGGFDQILNAPGGFEADSGDIAAMEVDRVERREDRMLAFVTLYPEETVFRYRIRATCAGLFTLPNATAEAMYDSSLSARTAAGLIEVK